MLRQGFLADYVVSQQMFLFFLPAMCVPGPQQVLFRALTNQAYAAGKQLKVMGYSIEDEVRLTSTIKMRGSRPLQCCHAGTCLRQQLRPLLQMLCLRAALCEAPCKRLMLYFAGS